MKIFNVILNFIKFIILIFFKIVNYFLAPVLWHETAMLFAYTIIGIVVVKINQPLIFYRYIEYIMVIIIAGFISIINILNKNKNKY